MRAHESRSQKLVPQQPLAPASTSRALTKMADIVTNIHMSLLNTQAMQENYRDLSDEEEQILEATKNNSSLNCLFAGILAIDTCISNLVKSQQQVQEDLLLAMRNLVNEYRVCGNYLSGEREKSEQIKSYSYVGDILLVVVRLVSRLSFCSEGKFQIEQLLIKELNLQENLKNKRMFISTIQDENSRLKEELAALKGRKSMIMLPNKQSLVFSNGHATERTKNHSIERESTNRRQTSTENLTIQRNLYSLSTKKADCVNQVLSSGEKQKLKKLKRLSQEERMRKRYEEIDCIMLLQHLEKEIKELRLQRQNDQWVINEIRDKIERIPLSKAPYFGESYFHTPWQVPTPIQSYRPVTDRHRVSRQLQYQKRQKHYSKYRSPNPIVQKIYANRAYSPQQRQRSPMYR